MSELSSHFRPCLACSDPLEITPGQTKTVECTGCGALYGVRTSMWNNSIITLLKRGNVPDAKLRRKSLKVPEVVEKDITRNGVRGSVLKIVEYGMNNTPKTSLKFTPADEMPPEVTYKDRQPVPKTPSTRALESAVRMNASQIVEEVSGRLRKDLEELTKGQKCDNPYDYLAHEHNCRWDSTSDPKYSKEKALPPRVEKRTEVNYIMDYFG